MDCLISPPIPYIKIRKKKKSLLGKGNEGGQYSSRYTKQAKENVLPLLI